MNSEKTGKVTACLIDLINQRNTDSDFLNLVLPSDIDQDVEIILFNDGDYVASVNQCARDGDPVIIDFENQKYFGVLRIDHLLEMVALELETGLPLAIGKENQFKVKKVVGIFRKRNHYKFERIVR